MNQHREVLSLMMVNKQKLTNDRVICIINNRRWCAFAFILN